LNNTQTELQDNKVHMIGFEEVSKEREKKLTVIKREIAECKIARDTIDIAHSTLKIKYERLEEENTTMKFNYDDVVDKLHHMNKARYELETKLTDSHE
jgi:predicted transcriptional regulator